MVRAFLARWRNLPPGSGPGKMGRRPDDAVTAAAPPRTCTCSPHRTRWLVVQPDVIRDTVEQRFLDTVLRLCLQVAQARTVVQDFGALVHTRQDC